MMVIHIFYY